MHKKQELSEEVERERKRKYPAKNEAHILYKYSTKTAKQKE